MKRLIAVILLLSCLVTLGGCGLLGFYYDGTEERRAFDTAVNALFSALDERDADAIYELFSPAVRAKYPDLREQIDRLLSVYSGPTDAIGEDMPLHSSATCEDGERIEESDSIFPVRSGDTYYWCDLKIMYVNTMDESQVGVTQINFYTADEYCLRRYDERPYPSPEGTGLSVWVTETVDEEIRCIGGWPYKYAPPEAPIDLEAVKDFLEASCDYGAFMEAFGAPAASNVYDYYELPSVDGRPRYLQIGHNQDQTIYGVSVVDEFTWVEEVWEEPEDGYEMK